MLQYTIKTWTSETKCINPVYNSFTRKLATKELQEFVGFAGYTHVDMLENHSNPQHNRHSSCRHNWDYTGTGHSERHSNCSMTRFCYSHRL